MDLTERTLKENLIYEGRIVTLYNDDVELPNKKTAKREYVKHPGGVSVAALTDKNELLFVKQYRYPYREVILELPAGKLNRGEDPFLAGKRELEEETGAKAAKYTDLGVMLPSPGYTDELLHLYLAEDLTMGDTNFDEDEFLDIIKIPLDKAVDMVMSGEITDAKSQTAILKTYLILQRR